MKVIRFVADFKFNHVGLQTAHHRHHSVGKFLGRGMAAIFANPVIVQASDEFNIRVFLPDPSKHRRVGQTHHFQRFDVGFPDELVIFLFKGDVVTAMQPHPDRTG
jgi:hypothetical protein